MSVTAADHKAMSWHQRQRFNKHLRAETARLNAEKEHLNAELARLNLPRVQALFAAADIRAEAARILATLPPDPDAATHRIELDRELTTRKANP